jgi:hypothetical protein
MAAQNEVEGTHPLVIDLGKHKRKRIRDLRRGRAGRLLDEVQACIEDLKAEKKVSESAQPIIIVVREKRKKRSWGW